MFFPGKTKLIALFDEIAAMDDDVARVGVLRSSLCQLIDEYLFALPTSLFDCPGMRPARRELYTSPRHGYSVVAMTWGPGQGTQIQDYSGMWCAEGIWYGRLEIAQYELVERDRFRYRFSPATTVEAGVGSARTALPPHEYYSLRNPSANDVAVSLHIHERTLMRCGVYSSEFSDSLQGGWRRREERLLVFDRDCS